MPQPLEFEEQAVVLFSGGQDSTTCLFWAKERFEGVTALFIHYGQRHAIEAEQARAIARLAETHLIEQELDLSGLWAANSLLDANEQLAVETPQGKLPATFVPGRNLLFLTLAGILAYRLNAGHIVGGMCQTDYSGYPDCRQQFVQAAQQCLQFATDKGFIIHTPLMFLDKAQTWQLADSLGCLEIVRDLSHTCYAGDRTTQHPWGFGCGQCDACRLRARGWKEAFGKE